MGHCTARCFVLTICVLQLITTVERQIFDFLGYMWVPIVGNFFQMLCVIFGFFGMYQYRPKYVIVYAAWMLTWIGWNIFIVCFYLEVGILDRDGNILNMGSGSRSWWETHGWGCEPTYNSSASTLLATEIWKKPVLVTGCLVEYQYVECIHAAIQIVLALIGFIVSCYIIHVFTQEDDSSPVRRNAASLQYSIEFRRHPPPENPYQHPMTPRRVKRRSTRSKRGSGRHFSYQNPVTKLMEQSGGDSSTSNESYLRQPPPPYRGTTNHVPGGPIPVPVQNRHGHHGHSRGHGHGAPAVMTGHVNPAYQSHPTSRPTSLHNGRPSPIYMNDSETVI